MSGAVFTMNGVEHELRYSLGAHKRVTKLLGKEFTSWLQTINQDNPEYIDKLIDVLVIGLEKSSDPVNHSYIEENMEVSDMDVATFAVVESMGGERMRRGIAAQRAKEETKLKEMEIEAGLRLEDSGKEEVPNTAPDGSLPLS
jgi:hypothetical protein